jgi:secreted trypsin-like serine protease
VSRRFAVAVYALALVSVVAAAPARAIIGGTIDTVNTAAALLYDDPLGALCSGVLIAPTVVLTAGSCLAADPVAENWVVSFDTQPFVGSATFHTASAVHVHPQFDSEPLAHDVGVVILFDPPAPTPLPWLAEDPGGVYTVGQPIAVTGYGLTTAGGSDSGVRRTRVLGATSIEPSTFTHTGDASAQICSGDAGGPAVAFVDTPETDPVNTVIGIASYGDQACASFSVFQRTDTEADFIAAFAPEPAPIACALATVASLGVATRLRV